MKRTSEFGAFVLTLVIVFALAGTSRGQDSPPDTPQDAPPDMPLLDWHPWIGFLSEGLVVRVSQHYTDRALMTYEDGQKEEHNAEIWIVFEQEILAMTQGTGGMSQASGLRRTFEQIEFPLEMIQEEEMLDGLARGLRGVTVTMRSGGRDRQGGFEAIPSTEQAGFAFWDRIWFGYGLPEPLSHFRPISPFQGYYEPVPLEEGASWSATTNEGFEFKTAGSEIVANRVDGRVVKVTPREGDYPLLHLELIGSVETTNTTKDFPPCVFTWKGSGNLLSPDFELSYEQKDSGKGKDPQGRPIDYEASLVGSLRVQTIRPGAKLPRMVKEPTRAGDGEGH